MSHLDAPATTVAPLLRIQEVAADVGLTTRTIRYYEELGLLKPAARSEGSYRLYDPDDLERLRFIKGLRDDAGFSLTEIGQLLEDEVARARNRERFRSTTDPDERRSLIDDAMTRVDRQVTSLRQKIGRLEEMVNEAEGRRAHLETHRAEIDAGLEPAPHTHVFAPMTIRFHGVRAFRHRNYRLFFAGQLISLVGTWMQQVAQAWLVLQLTHDPLWLGLVAVAQFAPVIVFGLFGGVIADHLPKRKTLLVTQFVAMILAFILFGLTASGIVEVWHVMILAALLGINNAVDMPTRQSFTVEMVGREDMTNAVGLSAAQFNASRILGPAVAGLLIGAFDISIAFLINALSYIAVIAAYLAMRESELRSVEPMDRPTSVRAVFENLAEGARYVRNTPLVLLGVVVVGLAATFGMNFQVLVPPLADNVLHVGASGFGFLMAASGVGSTIAALSVAFKRKVGPGPIVWGATALGLSSIVLALSTSYALSLLAMFVSGAGAIAMAVTANTTIQMAVPDQLRGRVMSVYTTVFAGSVPLGGLLMGFIASVWSVPAALMVGALVTLAIGIASTFWLRRIRRSERAARSVPIADRVAAGASGESPLTVARRR